MSETQTVETEQAAREASGAHPYGRYLEEFDVGAVYKHWPAKTVDRVRRPPVLPDHDEPPPAAPQRRLRGANRSRAATSSSGPLVYSLALGMSVCDVSGKAIANLATEELKHPAPVFHGDTLYCESEVLEKKESRSKPDRGTVKVHTRVLNQDGVLVAEFKRLVLVPRKNPGTARPRATSSRRRARRSLWPAAVAGSAYGTLRNHARRAFLRFPGPEALGSRRAINDRSARRS